MVVSRPRSCNPSARRRPLSPGLAPYRSRASRRQTIYLPSAATPPRGLAASNGRARQTAYIRAPDVFRVICTLSTLCSSPRENVFSSLSHAHARSSRGGQRYRVLLSSHDCTFARKLFACRLNAAAGTSREQRRTGREPAGFPADGARVLSAYQRNKMIYSPPRAKHYS